MEEKTSTDFIGHTNGTRENVFEALKEAVAGLTEGSVGEQAVTLSAAAISTAARTMHEITRSTVNPVAFASFPKWEDLVEQDQADLISFVADMSADIRNEKACMAHMIGHYVQIQEMLLLHPAQLARTVWFAVASVCCLKTQDQEGAGVVIAPQNPIIHQ